MISFYTLTGKMIDLEDFKPEDVDLFEIANALSNQGRYNGQTKLFYSVAEHSVLLAQRAKAGGMDENIQRALLMHDASEAYVGDIVYHLKGRFPFFKELENKIIKVIFDKFEIKIDAIEAIVNSMDRAICIDEMHDLMYKVDPELFKDPAMAPLNVTIKRWKPLEAKEEFMKLAKELRLQGA